MKNLIFNADDFGLTDGVTRGIVQCGSVGPLSTSVLVCTPGADKIVSAHLKTYSGGAGLHLQLTQGIPASPPGRIPSLVTMDGSFPARRPLEGAVYEEVMIEWGAQLERVRSWGVEPDHLDTHHDVHARARPGSPIFEAYTDLARETGLPVRAGSHGVVDALRERGVRCPDLCIHFSEMEADIQALLELLNIETKRRSEDISVEVGFHPGFADADLTAAALPEYCEIRQKELALFSDSGTWLQFKNAGWNIIRYRDFPNLCK